MRLFYCFAVPRSGTTLFGKLLDSHSQILCGHERFSPARLKRDNFSPEGFLTAESKRIDEEEMRVHLSTKAELKAIGDKLPRAYLHTSNLLAEIPDACFFAIVRDTRRIGASWNKRAANERDSWPKGMVSVFANIEFLIFAFALHALPASVEVKLVSYDYLTGADTLEECAGRICTALGVEPDDRMRKFIEWTSARARPSSPEIWSSYDEQFYNLPPISKLLKASQQWTVVDRASVRKDLADFTTGFQAAASDISALLREACEGAFAENPSAREYFARNFGAYRRAGRAVQLIEFIRTLRPLIDGMAHLHERER